MHRSIRSAVAVSVFALLSAPAMAQDASRAVSGGGISAPGWMGKIDAGEAARGMKLEDAKLMAMGGGLHVVTGPAVTYWNPANRAMGDYTVKATFREDKYMELNNHAHPYGIVIGGNDMGTDQMSYLYCATYGDGRFIVRGFGPAAFQVNGRRGETNEAINKAAAKGQPVSQEIAVSVRGDKVECSVNGTVVGSYDKAAVVGAGKLKATDGLYGIRVGHNAETVVTGLAMSKN
jgi:hypothetical protein